jgi:hypothetical protein
VRAGALVSLAVATVLATAPPAAGWTPPRTIATPRYQHDLELAFNAQGDTLLGAHNEGRGFTALRPEGGGFGGPRPYRAKNVFFATSFLLDPDGSALFLGDRYDRVPELEDPDSEVECCNRVLALPIDRNGRAGKRALLSPYAVESFLRRVETDRTGRAALVWSQDDDTYAALRSAAGRIGAPYRIEVPEGRFNEILVRPDGRGVTWWRDDERIYYASVSRAGAAGPSRTLFQTPARHDLATRELVVGTRGHMWLTWAVSEQRLNPPDVLYAAPRRADGRFGTVRRLGSTGTGYARAAVDDEGGLTVAWDDDPWVMTRFASWTGGVGRARRIGSGKLVELAAVAAGTGRRVVVAWERLRRTPERGNASDLVVATGARGRFGGPETIARSADDENIAYTTAGVMGRRAVVVAWNQTPLDRRTQIRYSVLAP